MNSETTFTASSGHVCQFEIFLDAGEPAVNCVWLSGEPSTADLEELAAFVEGELAKAGMATCGGVVEHHMLGSIEREDLARAREIFEERRGGE